MKQLRVVMFVGGVEFIGELEHDYKEGFAALWSPCILRFQPPDQLQLQEMLRGSPILTGEYLNLNMQAVQWIGKPTKDLEDAYMRLRSGIVKASEMPIGINQ